MKHILGWYSAFASVTLVALLYLQFFNVQTYEVIEDFEIEFRRDYEAIFNISVYNKLVGEYDSETEQFYCLIGNEQDNVLYINDIVREATLQRTKGLIIYERDPPCQINGTVGSIHTHPIESGCKPSDNDLYTFGEMKNPEPIINIIQCGSNDFLILKMPGKQEGFDYKGVYWKAIG